MFINLYKMQKSKHDVSNFDKEFTSEPPKLSPIEGKTLDQWDQAEFAGFSYVAPAITATTASTPSNYADVVTMV